MALLWALVGLIVGPFLRLAIYRLPRKQKLLAPVRCPGCQQRRPLHALSALLTTLLGARGRCASCGMGPERLDVAVEVATAVAFGLLFLRFGPNPRLLLYSLYGSILIVVLFIDWQHRLILNRVTYPSLLLALVLTPALTPVGPTMALLGAAVGGVVFALVFGVGYLAYRRAAMALGDVKLAAVLGAMTGFPGVVPALLLGTFVGAAASTAVLATRRGSRHDYMPYGPALCLGTFISFFLDIPGA